MSTTDPIADMLTRIRNAVMARAKSVVIPDSRMKRALAQTLQEEGYVSRFEITRSGRFPMIRIHLKYTEDRHPVLRGLERVSKPGCRIYAKKAQIPWVQSGLGTVILSTPRGVLTGREARRVGVGGEVLCKVW
ncbi:MAG TPA: 30S ribosomal protein S8 [Anaerolineae bacterium]|nr:30S ribosomal protein S8 [Anaerolineae bacterium]